MFQNKIQYHCPLTEKSLFGKLIAHYGEDREAETVDGEETVKAAMISTEIRTEWKTFRQLLVKQPQDTTASQLKELVSNDMLKAMFLNLNKIASIGLTIPVSTASVERSFSQMKMIKTRLRNSLSDCSLSHLMRIAIAFNENCYRGTRSIYSLRAIQRKLLMYGRENCVE